MNTDAFRMMTVEMQIYNLISNCREGDETILMDRHFDFTLPNGLKKLDWPKETIIEVKKRLIYDSLNSLKFYIDKYSPAKLILIVEEETSYYYNFAKINNLYGIDIEVKLFSEFLIELVEKIGYQQLFLNDYLNLYHEETQKINKRSIKEDISNNRFSLFLGAGVSMDAKVPSWKDLLNRLSYKKRLLVLCNETDNIVKGRYIVETYKKDAEIKLEEEKRTLEKEKIKEKDQDNEKNKDEEVEDQNRKKESIKDLEIDYKKRELFNNDMRDVLYKNVDSSLLIDAISDLIVKHRNNIESVISYNYDNLLEQKLKEDLKNNPDINECIPVFEKTKALLKNTLYIKHVHGFIDEDPNSVSSDIVLGEKEYHKLYDESNNWGNVEQLHALNNSICVFIGLSMTDPNLRRLLDLAIDGSNGDKIHYVFLNKQCDAYMDFMVKDLHSLGVKCIWYNQYKELPGLLKELF